MAFCSFSSLVGELCGPSPENPHVIRLLDLKNRARDVKAHLKFCNILTGYCSLQKEMGRNEMEICSLQNENL